MRTVLIDVDTQHDFCDPTGALYVKGADALAPRFRELVARAVATSVPIVSSVDSHAFDAWEFAGAVDTGPNGESPGFPPHCVKGTPGWLKVPGTTAPRARFVPNVAMGSNELATLVRRHEPQHLLLEKEVYSLFANPNADAVLDLVLERAAGVRFVVFGVATDYCVRAAVLGLLDWLERRVRRGEVWLVADAVAAVNEDSGSAAISESRARGARAVTTEEALAALGYPMLCVALCQLDTTIGDLSGNAARILTACRKSRDEGAELAVAPELAITGYPPRDLLNVAAFVRATEAAVDEVVRNLPDGLVAVFGAPRRRAGPGRTLVNTAIVARRGEIVLEVPKALLPTYDVFDERRYFEPAPAETPRVVDVFGTRVGITICEDAWNDRLLWPSRFYDRDPVAECIEQGAELIVNASASPFSQGKWRTRRSLLSHAARRWQVPIAYANAVGGQDGLVFDGGSLAYAADGSPCMELPYFAEARALVDFSARPALDEPDPMAQLEGALVLGLGDYARKTGMTRWALGLSGGIDSALVAVIGHLALGSASGATFGLPSRYSSDHSIADARSLAQALGLPFEVVPIEDAHAAYERTLTPVFASLPEAPPTDATFENVQARIRGGLLMAWANRTNSLLLTTGNKSECSVGYSTLYGDSCGGLAVIADLWKLEVYALARWLNVHRVNGAIPESTLTKPPSAELRPGQRDDQALPPYEDLDPMLRALVEDELGVDEAAAATRQPIERVRAIYRKVTLAEYKRRQFAPTLRVSTRGWTGRDYPIASAWKG